MTCGHCSATSHNLRTCPILQRREEVFQVVPLSATQPSEESAFMITPGFSASSSQLICQPIDEDEIGDELEVEDEQPLLRPRALYEAKTRLKIKKLQQKPTATRKINFGVMKTVLVYLLICHIHQER
ncbi:uncharacterized protein LOC107861001 [Capsicum annuum]|uniref:uncharacterized protein LOC107861001 n=1 Tax=Capsicum annuum TaxID=4072 RepID=UPI001FB04C92|nr:uncharacterized protein LOC107861001 [Capsicum annuum]